MLGAALMLTSFLGYQGPEEPELLPWILAFDAALSAYLLLWLPAWAAGAGTVLGALLVPPSARPAGAARAWIGGLSCGCAQARGRRDRHRSAVPGRGVVRGSPRADRGHGRDHRCGERRDAQRVRHAGPGTTRSLTAHADGEQITAIVHDDGGGFAPALIASGSLGISGSIVGRMRGLPGGAVTVSSRPGGPTTVRLGWRA